MPVKRIAAVNDLSGIGRCSLTVALPILSALGAQACPLPTAVLSAHTGYPSFSFFDFSDHMETFLDSWQTLDVRFDAVFTGFLGSARSIGMVARLFESQPQALRIFDPVMGDGGEIYKTYTHDMCNQMRRLCRGADIVTPNLTEACILTGQDYPADFSDRQAFIDLARRLQALGAKNAVITGLPDEGGISNIAVDAAGRVCVDRHERVESYCSGTGDIFASVVTGLAAAGTDFIECVKRAGDFVARALEYTLSQRGSLQDGVIFEPLLYLLTKPL